MTGSHVQDHSCTITRPITVAHAMDVKLLTISCGVQQPQIITQTESGATAFAVNTSVDYRLYDGQLVFFAGVCQCDPGYSGKSCETVTQTLPHYLNESFEDDLLSSKWGWVAGGSIDVTCGTVASGSSMVFK